MDNPPQLPKSYYRRKLVQGYQTRTGRLVDPYYRSYWIVEFPVALEEIDLTSFGKERYAPGPRIPPPPAPKPKGPKPRLEWGSLSEFVSALYSQYLFLETQDPLIRIDPDSDVISKQDGLIWHEPIPLRTMKAINASEAGLVRAWILLYNQNSDEYFIFSRCRSLLLSPEISRKSFEGIYAEAVSLYNNVVEWAEDKMDYIEVRQLLAWTFWKRPRKARASFEKAPHKKGYTFKKIKGPKGSKRTHR